MFEHSSHAIAIECVLLSYSTTFTDLGLRKKNLDLALSVIHIVATKLTMKVTYFRKCKSFS